MSEQSDLTSDFFNDDVATFGDRIEAARNAKGLSVKQLADRLGVKQKSVSAWENDVVSPRANKTQMLAGVLNVSLIWLISGQSNGSDYVEQAYDRSDDLNETLGEIKALRKVIEQSLLRIQNLETRLEKAG